VPVGHMGEYLSMIRPGKKMRRREALRLLGVGAGSTLFSALGSHALAAPAARCARAGSNKPNVILIIVDSLRSDHISANGYLRPATSYLDAWVASQGVSFQDATSPAAWTYPAGAAIMTGQSPFRLNATWDNTTLPTDVTTLAEYLHDAGYYTAGFVSTGFLSMGRGFARGFDKYDDSVAFHPTSYQGVAEELGSLALSWLTMWTQQALSQPLFLFLYYIDPHTWYYPLSPYDTLYDSTYSGTLTPQVFRDSQDIVSGQIVPTQRDVEHLLALYDGEISYWDAHLGQVFSELQSYQLFNDALVIVTSDHGEAFGEHGEWTHGNCLYEEVLRVPLIMRYAGVISPGTKVTTPVQNMDLMPTILDWLGIPIPAHLDAVSLRPLVDGSSPTTARDIFSELDGINDPSHWAYWNAPRDHLRCVQRDGWKYIHHMNRTSADELYQLKLSSVYEADNLITSESARAQELRQAVLNWFGIPPYQTHIPLVTK
jgi:arylsulfatase A-like enzyme